MCFKVSAKEVLLSAIAAVGLVLGVAAAPAFAGVGGQSASNGAKLFEWGAIGSGSSTIQCDTETKICTATFTGKMNGNAIGRNATVSSTLQWNLQYPKSNGLGANCYLVAGTGTITTRRNAELNLSESGRLCGSGQNFTPVIFQGVYYVTGGTKKFTNSVGSGNATASSDASGAIIFRVDGGLTLKGKTPPPG